MSLQKKISQELHVQPSIDPKQEIEKRVGFLKEYLKKPGQKDLFSVLAAGRIQRLLDVLHSLLSVSFVKKEKRMRSLLRYAFRMVCSRMKMMHSSPYHLFSQTSRGNMILHLPCQHSVINIKRKRAAHCLTLIKEMSKLA